MSRLMLGILGMGIVLSLATQVAPAAEKVKVGDKAPPFSLQGTDGKTYSLDQFKGKQAVILAWFPKADTPGCTKECKSLREHGNALRPLNVAYFTVSVDTPADNKKFAEKLGLDYPILSDPGKEVAEAYGVVHEGRKYAERWTFYIDKDGVIKEVDTKIKTDNAGPDIARKVKALGLSD